MHTLKTSMKKVFLFLIAIVLILGIFVYQNIYRNTIYQNENLPKLQNNIKSEKIATIAENLETPWEIAFLPNGSILISERLGKITLVQDNKNAKTIAIIDDVKHVGEGGLLGLTLHPNFAENNYLFVYYTYASDGNNTFNRVVRYTLKNNSLSERQIIINEIPGATIHNGGRLAFGPDNFLYITTGDAAKPSLAQNTKSLAGKILRVDEDGNPAPDNPFANEVYSYGHRNPQGLAWRSNELWATEHGPSGNDEINRIEIGKNYGWPNIQGNQTSIDMQPPVIHSGNKTWAPAGLIYHNNRFYFVGLRGQTLYSLDPNNPNKGVDEHLKNAYGRLRAITKGPNNEIYISTSNRDGRGSPVENDDRILRIANIN